MLLLVTMLFYWETSMRLHMDTWHQGTVCSRSIIGLLNMSSDLWLYVLDPLLKRRRAELSTDHNLVVSWLRWWGRTLNIPGTPKYIVRVHSEPLS